MGYMKTTLELPDELMRRVKLRAVHRNQKLKEAVAQLLEAAQLRDLLGGLFKAFVFGVLVSFIGCLRGFETGAGPRAVGVSATSAVVSGIVMIVVADGLFAVVYYQLGV